MAVKLKRILFFAEAVTLAHLSRCITLSEGLFKTGRYTVCLAADDRYDAIIGDIPFQRLALKSVASAIFFKKLAKGVSLYDVKTLTAYVEEDVKIIDSFKPDFIIGDFRLSLAISCQLKKIPYATITNAYWSPYADIDYPIPEIPLTNIVGVAMAQKLFDWFRPVVFAIHSLAFNKTCKKFGLPPFSYDMRDIYTHADFTLYADMKSIIPMKPYPDNHVFIDPVLWSADVALPTWWDDLPDDKPIVFISLGSSGDGKNLPVLLQALSTMPVTVIAVTASKSKVEHTHPNCFLAEFLPAEIAVKKADIVICNGGSPMVYQTLLENKALLGIPGNLDQYLMMGIIKSANRGEYIRSGQLQVKKVQSAVQQLLLHRKKNPSFYKGEQENKSPDALEKIESLIQAACQNTK